MADLIFYGCSRWLSVAVTERPRVRKNRYLIELECADRLALLPVPEAIARTVVKTTAGQCTPVSMDSDHEANGRHYLALQVSNRDLAERAADLLVQIPREWLYDRGAIDAQAIDDLARDPIASGISYLSQKVEEEAAA